MKAKPIGTPVFCFGRFWIISSRPFVVPGFEGTSQKIVRFTRRGTWQFSSICTVSPPVTNGHHWQPMAEYLTPKLAAALFGVWHGHPAWVVINRNACQYRREKKWARHLKAFFKSANRLEEKWHKRAIAKA